VRNPSCVCVCLSLSLSLRVAEEGPCAPISIAWTSLTASRVT
jgi:hypothetical protein